APPRWGEHWGNGWAQQRSGWDHWDRRASLAPAPLPVYQRQYSGNRYPHVEQQQALHSRNYRYQPRDAVVRQHVQQPVAPVAVAPSRQQQAAPNRIPDQQPRPALQNGPQQQGAERRDLQVQAASPGAEHGQRQGQGQGQGRGDSQSKGHEQDRDEDSTGRQHKRWFSPVRCTEVVWVYR